MASSSSDRDRPDGKDHPLNPFVAFRRFADSQMSSLMSNVFGVFESSPIRRQRAIEEYEALLRRSREESSDYPRSQPADDHEARPTRDYSWNSNNPCSSNEDDNDEEHVAGERGRALEKAATLDEQDDYCFGRPDVMPDHYDIARLRRMIRIWSIINRRQSAPQENLNDLQNAERHGISLPPKPVFCGLMREAFGIRTTEPQTEDRPSDPQKPDFCDLVRRSFFTKEEESQTKAHAPVERTAVDSDGNTSQWAIVYCSPEEDSNEEAFGHGKEEFEESKVKDGENEETPSSELDLYHALLHPQVEQKRPQGVKVEEQVKIENKPSILSTLTTTERRTLPDGSMTTKIVLKKRFSNGVEEETENFHTQHPPPPPLPHVPVNKQSIAKQDPNPDQPKSERRNGWFWS